MKKSILIVFAVFATFGLTAFSFLNWGNSTRNSKEVACVKPIAANINFVNPLIEQFQLDLVYDVEPRFLARITKADLHNAKSIIDIIPKEGTDGLEAYSSVKVSVISPDEEMIKSGDSEILNSAQRKLLQSTNYSSNIWITADCKEKSSYNGKLVDYDLVYYMTVIPEKEAEYSAGYDALIEYLKESSKEETAIIQKDQLRPGRVNFTVTKEGTIENVELDSTSGYLSADIKMVELITDMPEKWNPATNSKGEKVDQDLVFFFGLKGC